MEKDRGFRIMAVVALLIAVTGLSIAYAAYTTTLTINGSAAVSKTGWDVHFVTTSGTGSTVEGVATGHAESTDATLAATTISGFKATLAAPGDSVSYTFNVKNDGTLDAKLTTLTKGTLSCGENQSFCDENLTYTLTYDTANGAAVTQSDELASNQAKTLVLTVTWKSDSTTQVATAFDVTVGTTSLVFTQN